MTRQIYAGPVAIGGGAPVSIQSMLNTRTTDVEGSLRQIRQLAAAGCEIARLAIPDMDAAHAFREICAHLRTKTRAFPAKQSSAPPSNPPCSAAFTARCSAAGRIAVFSRGCSPAA